ncbi:unnamed protein product, partial [Closterium sp. NIES-54]
MHPKMDPGVVLRRLKAPSPLPASPLPASPLPASPYLSPPLSPPLFPPFFPQMMDPKMDAGMGGGKGESEGGSGGKGGGEGGARGEVESVGEAVERGLLPLPLPADRIVDLCDGLLCAEATWHSSHSLPQTVFTCAYLLLPPLGPPSAGTPSPSPSLSSSPLLLALLSATLACVNSVRSAACWTHQRE